MPIHIEQQFSKVYKSEEYLNEIQRLVDLGGIHLTLYNADDKIIQQQERNEHLSDGMVVQFLCIRLQAHCTAQNQISCVFPMMFMNGLLYTIHPLLALDIVCCTKIVGPTVTLIIQLNRIHCFWQDSDSVCTTVFTVTLSKKKEPAHRAVF